MLHNYKMVIAYDGTNYCGWQVQPNGLSVQEVLQDRMRVILRSRVAIIGSGRTDAGVHAAGQVAHFHFPEQIDLYRFSASINGLLPPDIRVKGIVEVPMDFHAQYSTAGKEYHYHLHLDRVLARFFLGVHDFTSFANESHAGCAAHDPVRTLRRLDIVDQPGGVRLEFEGDGFLYRMVRNITGTLVEVALGKRPADEVPALLAAKDRNLTGQAAPPQGLFLMRVSYVSTP